MLKTYVKHFVQRFIVRFAFDGNNHRSRAITNVEGHNMESLPGSEFRQAFQKRLLF